MAALGKILIVGSGIGGQALAVALAKHDIDCEIVEIKPAWEILGAGTALLGPAMRALEEIGIAEDVYGVSWSHEGARFLYRDAHGDVVVETAVGARTKTHPSTPLPASTVLCRLGSPPGTLPSPRARSAPG